MKDLFIREKYNYKGEDIYAAENMFMKGKIHL